MIAPDKKKLASIIMVKMGKKPMESEPNDMENKEDTDSEDFAAEEVMNALEKKDTQGFKEALKSLIQICMDKYESSEPETEGSQD